MLVYCCSRLSTSFQTGRAENASGCTRNAAEPVRGSPREELSGCVSPSLPGQQRLRVVPASLCPQTGPLVAGTDAFPPLRLNTSRDFSNFSDAFFHCTVFLSCSFKNCCFKCLWKRSVFLLASSKCFTFKTVNVRPYSHFPKHDIKNSKVMLVFGKRDILPDPTLPSRLKN